MNPKVHTPVLVAADAVEHVEAHVFENPVHGAAAGYLVFVYDADAEEFLPSGKFCQTFDEAAAYADKCVGQAYAAAA